MNRSTAGLGPMPLIDIVLIGLFLYVLSCKEPFPGTHEEFVTPLWKQGLGSTIH